MAIKKKTSRRVNAFLCLLLGNAVLWATFTEHPSWAMYFLAALFIVSGFFNLITEYRKEDEED